MTVGTPRVPVVPTRYDDILTDRPIGHLATIRPDGLLSVHPVSLMWDGMHVRVAITIHARQVSVPRYRLQTTRLLA